MSKLESGRIVPMNRWPWASAKRLAMLAIASFAILMTACTSAKSQLTQCNKTQIPLFIALGINEAGTWRSRGWWYLDPGTCADIVSGNLKQRYYYIYAQSAGSIKVWGNDAKFCVEYGRNFDINDNTCRADDSRIKKFFKVDTGKSKSWRQDLTCDSCRLPIVDYDKKNQRIRTIDVVQKNVAGRDVSFSSFGIFNLSINGDKINVAANIDIDLRRFQNMMPGWIANSASSEEECGNRFSIYNVVVTPGQPNARVRARGRYEKWYCTYADVPQVRCEDTWIIADVPFIGRTKTKGVPSCTTSFKTTRTSKSKILQQSGSITLSLLPSISNGFRLGVDAIVDDVNLDGMGDFFARIFRLNVRSMAQSRIDETLAGSEALRYAIPYDIRPYTQLQSAMFYDRGGGSLGLKIEGRFDIRSAGVIDLCRKLWPAGRCEATDR